MYDFSNVNKKLPTSNIRSSNAYGFPVYNEVKGSY